jgi:hypothetical protein
MYERVTRLVLAFMAVGEVIIGAWAGFAPRSFYDDFPSSGRPWVSPDGPYNEHLVRDVGVLNLALAVVIVAALVWLSRPLVRATAVAWLVYSVPHLVYHARHLDPFDTTDQVSMIASLVLAPLLGVALLVLSNRLQTVPSPTSSREHARTQ